MSRILVTGASGFLGEHVVLVLGSIATEVRRFERPADIRDAAAVRAAVDGATAIVHLAASPAYRAEGDPRRDAEVNVVGTLNVLRAARAVGARVIFTSSSHVYGQHAKPVDESAEPRPLTVYGASKLAAETYVAQFGRAYGLRHTILRLSILYGEPVAGRPPPNVATVFAAAALEGRPLVVRGDAHRGVDLLDVREAARAIVLALGSEAAADEVLNIGSGGALSLGDVAACVVAAARTESRVVVDPDAPPGPGVVLDVRKARQMLGFRPRTGVREGIAEFVARRRNAVANIRE